MDLKLFYYIFGSYWKIGRRLGRNIKDGEKNQKTEIRNKKEIGN
jgi:hypothetical protein